MLKSPSFEARPAAPAAPRASDTEITAVFQDAAKKAIPPKGPQGEAVERLRKADAFGARAGSVHYVRFGGKGSAENALFAGMGQAAEATEEKARVAGGSAWSRLRAEKARAAVVQLESFLEAKGVKTDAGLALAVAFAEGLALAAYEFDKYKTQGKSEEGAALAKVTFVAKDAGLRRRLASELERVEAAAESVRVTRDWSNEPSNYGTPAYYAGEAAKLAKKYGLKCKILTEKDAAREKMGLFLGVGRGAGREGRVVVVEYAPKGVAASGSKTVALVGKGVTFDSGGISIKPSARMEEMKHDMTGAATVFGATLLAARMGCPNRIVTVMGFTENMPDGDAIQPGNVLTSRSGKTVEVINTDAEGRLVLGDMLDLAQDYKPDAVVDAATLTGAVSIALGKQCCGVLGNEDSLIESLRRAGDSCGERMWQLPLFEEYFEDIKSDHADMKNSANDSYGGTIRGAMFLKQFVRKGVAWAHLDIAATAWNLSHLSYFPKRGASGAYVRTLARFAIDY